MGRHELLVRRLSKPVPLCGLWTRFATTTVLHKRNTCRTRLRVILGFASFETEMFGFVAPGPLTASRMIADISFKTPGLAQPEQTMPAAPTRWPDRLDRARR